MLRILSCLFTAEIKGGLWKRAPAEVLSSQYKHDGIKTKDNIPCIEKARERETLDLIIARLLCLWLTSFISISFKFEYNILRVAGAKMILAAA